MTLRHRLLLVYSIVVLLSVATVGVAIFELRHARQIIRELKDWNAIVFKVDEFRYAFRPPTAGSQDEVDFALLIPNQYLELAQAPEYLNVERVRQALINVKLQYDKWLSLDQTERPDRIDMVRKPLDNLASVLNAELGTLNLEAEKQDIRTLILLIAVIILTLLHVSIIGSLLRRWLLWPMEQLNRQVSALAQDKPPAEPLLTKPLEMANLAHALDQARRSLGTLRRQLLDAERLTTIGQFAAQLAHNLRNPLASIRATAQVAARHDPDNGYIANQMKEIVASVDRLNQWIVGLMEIARREPTPTRNADIVPILHRVHEALVSELAAKELTLTISAPQAGLICAHDSATLEQALIAMIVNAIEASPLGKTIELRAEYMQIADQPSPAARISVRDHGYGLPTDDPERIFEFSYSTKQRGMGLGLALARQVLQRQSGSVQAQNNPDGGATIYVILPINPPDDKMNKNGIATQAQQ